MQYFLLIGAALNFIGAIKLSVESVKLHASTEPEHLQLKLFVVGVALTFGLMYLYLFFNIQHIYPFLAFGAAPKAWAFLTCLYLLLTSRIGYKFFLEFGLSNGVVAIMFAILLARHA